MRGVLCWNAQFLRWVSKAATLWSCGGKLRREVEVDQGFDASGGLEVALGVIQEVSAENE